MKSLFAKVLMMACLALVLGVKTLAFFSAGQTLFLQRPHNSYRHALHQAAPDEAQKHLSQAPVKKDNRFSSISEDNKDLELELKTAFTDELHKLFSDFAKFALSSRIQSFYKSYSILLSMSAHHSPLYVLDHALRI